MYKFSCPLPLKESMPRFHRVLSSSGRIVSGSSAEGGRAGDLQGFREQRGLTLQLDDFTREVIDEEAARLGESVDDGSLQ